MYSLTSPSMMKPNAVKGAAEPNAKSIRLCRNFAMQKLKEAQDNDVFVCGIQPFHDDDLMYGVITHREL